MDILTYLITAAALILGLVSVYLFRRSTGYHHLLQEAANRFEEGRRINESLKKINEEHRSELELLRQTSRRLDQQNAEFRAKTNLLQIELKKASELPTDELNSILNKNDILTEELKAVTNQLRMADRERTEWKNKAENLEKETTAKYLQTIEDKNSEIKGLKDIFSNLEAVTKKESSETIQTLTSEIQVLKKKLVQHNHMMKSIKGTKEMLEERIGNWETALRILSSHVLGSENTNKHQKIGVLVGSALESIGQEILPEEADSIQHDPDSVNTGTSNRT